MRKRFAIVGIFAAALVAWILYLGTIMPPKRVVMWYGSDIKEHYQGFGFLPDFNYAMSASIDPDDFPGIAQRLKLAPQTSETNLAQIGINWGDCPEPWWPKDLTLSGAHFRHEPEDDFFALATVRDGRLYYYCVRW